MRQSVSSKNNKYFSNMRVVRTFHPIGEGVFNTEKIDLCEGEATIVYNCGSTSLDKSGLDRIIEKALPKGALIDLLFISDFYAEHINGLETLKSHCQIGTVVLPDLSYEERIRTQVVHHLDFFTSNKPTSSNKLPCNILECLINDPESFFGPGTRIIRIKPEKDWDPIEVNISPGGDWHIPQKRISIGSGSGPGQGEVFPSGSPVVLIPIKDWIFIPIYHEQESQRKVFEEELKKVGLSLQDIDTIEKIEANEKKLSKVSGSIRGNRESSMLLYSGVVDARADSYILGAYKDSKPYRCFKDHKYYHQLKDREYKRYLADCEHNPYLKDNEPRKYWYYECYRTSVPSGCLYTGNIDLSEDRLVDKISRKLSAFTPALGTIQVPHHGAAENFDPSILKVGALHCAVASFDSRIQKPYSVIRDVLLDGLLPCLVTEDPKSIEVQYT